MKKLLCVAMLLLATTSCIASKARENSLLPAMNLAWPGVRADVERGIEDAVQDGELADRIVIDFEVVKLDEALKSGLASDFRSVSWLETLEPYGRRGIEDRVADGEMSDMVAESLRERLRNFTVGFSKMSEVVYRHPYPTNNETWLPDGTQVAGGYAVSLDGTYQRLTVTN